MLNMNGFTAVSASGLNDSSFFPFVCRQAVQFCRSNSEREAVGISRRSAVSLLIQSGCFDGEGCDSFVG